ncbi:MAG: hypothetical protein SCK29_10855 [Bacillota bacterium]|nr:hypothetical protein [Bacillota bacterium]MDW7684602.1 hypothetical protein [Bacillota bacterium]
MPYLLFFVINVLMAAWVSEDAKKRDKSGVWGVLVFFTGIVGLLIYFAVREGLQSEHSSAFLVTKVMTVLFILSLSLNVYFYANLNRVRENGKGFALQTMSAQVDTLSQMSRIMEIVLNNPENSEQIKRLVEINFASGTLYGMMNSQAKFIDREMIDELFRLAVHADQIVESYYYPDEVAALTEAERNELQVFTANLIEATSEINEMLFLIFSQQYIVRTGTYNLPEQPKIVEMLKTINNEHSELGIIQGGQW